MDEKKLKSMLDKELDKLMPSMSAKVKNAPVLTKSEQVEKSRHKIDVIPQKRKNASRPFIYGAIAAVLVIAIALSIIIPATMGGGETPVPVYEAGYLRLDINPSVELIYDKDLRVTAVKSANGDADVLLSEELRKSVSGKTVDEAAAMIADEAGKLGYILPESENAVRITVVSNSDSQQDKVITKTTAAIETNFMQKGILCAVVAVKEDADYLAGLYGTAADDLKSAVESVAAKADSYFEQLAASNTSALEELRSYYEKEVFEYLRDLLKAECSRISRTRELLHQAQELNDEIKRYTVSIIALLGIDYWGVISTDDWKDDVQLADMCNRMTAVLADIEKLREDAVDNSADLLKLILAYDLFIDEEWIEEIGNATIDELKGCMNDILDELEKLNIEITAAVQNAISAIPESVAEFLDGTQTVIDGMRSELEEIYLAYYEEDRPAYTAEDYDSFYMQITTEYGSLEAYWQARENA